MDFKKIADLIKKDAPMIAGLVGSINPVAGILIKLLFTAFDAKNAEDLEAKISNDATSSIKLRQMELEHQCELSKLINSDRASARDRESSFVRTTGKRDLFLLFIAVLFLGFFTAFIVGHIFQWLPLDACSGSIFNTLSNLTGTIVSYYFG